MSRKNDDRKIPNAARGEKVPKAEVNPSTGNPEIPDESLEKDESPKEEKSFFSKVADKLNDVVHPHHDDAKPSEERAARKSGKVDPGSQSIQQHSKYDKFKKGSSQK